MGRKKGRRRSPFKLKLRKDLLYSVGSILLFSLAGLIIISFSRQGVILEKINYLLVGTFSWTALFLPFIIINAGLLLTEIKWPIAKPNIFAGEVLLYFGILGFFSAGQLGEGINASIASLVSPAGALVIFAGLGFIGFIILSEKSLDELLLALSKIIRSFFLFFHSLTKLSSSRSTTIPSPDEIKVTGLKTDDDRLKAAREKAIDAKVSSTAPEPKPADLGTQVISNLPGSEQIVWEPPPIDLLSDNIGSKADRGDIKSNAHIIEKTLDSFGIQAHVVEVNCGPAVTQYALEIALGTKLSKITALQNDLALALAAPTGQIRIEAPIPGRNLLGIEIPNHTLEFVPLKKMLQSDLLKKNSSILNVALGLDVSGQPVFADIGRMPHILIAGSTGSGKSVCINSFLATMLFRASPNEIKLILIDPKRVELTQFNDIPHLLTPVIVEPDKVIAALKWAMEEMDRRYRLFAEVGVRNTQGYNELAGFQALPFLLIFVDELADIILFAPSEVEDCIIRLAQMARATGIHLIISTQRPSVDVLTGLIKANITCRIAFNVSSMVDSRVILDMPGAEKLLGRGDMLFIPPDRAKPIRIQGTYVSEPEINRLITHLKNLGVKPQYTEEVTTKYKSVADSKVPTTPGGDEIDPLFDESVRVVCQYDRASASLLQRRLSIGYARAARILDQLQSVGVVSQPEGSKPRDVLIRDATVFLAKYHGHP